MASLRSFSKPAAIAGVLALSGFAAAPALAYPPGVGLTIACSATTLTPGAAFTCTLSNINPAGPNDIAVGGLIASGDGTQFALASVTGQDTGTYTEDLTAPSTAGTYEVVGTSADETATTQITVVAESGGGGTTGPTTPQTGANVTLGLVAGLGALGLGGGLYAASRRKRV